MGTFDTKLRDLVNEHISEKNLKIKDLEKVISRHKTKYSKLNEAHKRSLEVKVRMGTRPLHSMTVEEFREMSGDVGWSLKLGEQLIERMSTSLYLFHSVLGTYGNFDSITWLIEHNFDLSFQEARKSGENKL